MHIDRLYTSCFIVRTCNNASLIIHIGFNWKMFFEIATSTAKFILVLSITRNMGQDGVGHAHFDQIWRPNIAINYMGVDQNIKF